MQCSREEEIVNVMHFLMRVTVFLSLSHFLLEYISCISLFSDVPNFF